jgi:predicted DNA-binding transcriptional regulator AlpA
MTKPRRALRLPAVEQKTGMKKSQILDAVSKGHFPKPFNVLPGGRAIAWVHHGHTAHRLRRKTCRCRLA